MRNELWRLAAGCSLLASLGTGSPTQAADKASQKINQKIQIDTTVDNPCTAGETMHLTGVVRVVLGINTTKEGAQVKGQIDAGGINGESSPGGRKYTASGKGSVNATGGAPPTQISVSAPFHLNSKGSTENLNGTVTFKIDTQADGTNTVAAPSVELTCK